MHPLPLPLHSIMFQCLHLNRTRLVCLAFAAGVYRGPGKFPRPPMERQREAALCVSVHLNAGWGGMHSLSWAPVKMGDRGKGR